MHLTLQRWREQSGLSGVSYHVRDDTGQVLASHQAQIPRHGASTVKLLTAAAALRTLGPDHRFRVELLHDGDQLHVRGCHPWLQVQELVDLTSGIEEQAKELTLDDSRYPRFEVPSGWDRDDLVRNVQPVMPLNLREYFGQDPSQAVAEAVAGLLTARGQPTRYVGRGQARGMVVGTADSAPVRDIVTECLLSSHNLMAEILGRETAIAMGLPPRFESMQEALTTGLTTSPEGLHLMDASGLSRHDRVRADVLTHVLHEWRDPRGRPMVQLPIAGLTGTLSAINDWFQSGPAAQVRGYVQAKSGSHVGCVALAGYTFAPGRPPRTFAILVDGLAGRPPHRAAKRAIEEFVHLVATSPRGQA